MGVAHMSTHPNVVFVFADQWRAQAFGYAGDPNVHTPCIDRFAQQTVNFSQAVAGCPVCSPYRGSLMTGQYPHTHGMVVNDQCLFETANAPYLAEAFATAGYDTAYIGKWHLDGHGRTAFVPPERRLGFQFWRGYECTHDYNRSIYYADDDIPLEWDGYDAIAQTTEACRYLTEHDRDRPFALVLSWGPPHNPYQTAPEEYRRLYDATTIHLRDNVPPEAEEAARQDLAGYYAHCTALDACFGELLGALETAGLAEETIVVFTSDHGDMLGSRGFVRKQKPWEESIRVPFLILDPLSTRSGPRSSSAPIDAPDIMPTLLGLCGIPVPSTVQGTDFAPLIREGQPVAATEALLALYLPFHEWRYDNGGKEYRGLRTERYTYVRDLRGPWLLYDNDDDPSQMMNLCADPGVRDIQGHLDAVLTRKLAASGDDFPRGAAYVERLGIELNSEGDVLIRP